MLKLITLLALVPIIFIWILRYNVCGAPSTTEKDNGTTRFVMPTNIYNPNYGYQPYWPGGDWKKEEDPKETSTTEKVPKVCGRDCNYLYRPIKHVCARNIWKSSVDGCSPSWWTACKGNPPDYYDQGFQNFDSYCEFLDESCRSRGTGKQKTLLNSWVFVHVGKCKEQNLTIKPLYYQEPISRMKFYISSQADTFLKLDKKPCS